jgi:hypothetical protein
MDALSFAYWLQGFSELNPDLPAPSPEQWKSIKEHLQLVFAKVTPPMRGPVVGGGGTAFGAARRSASPVAICVGSGEWIQPPDMLGNAGGAC